MKKLQGYDEAQALTGEYERLEAGGYICKIKGAKEETSKNGKKMLVIAFDIEEGEHKGFYQRQHEENMKNADPNNMPKWRGVYRQMLEGEKAVGYLKGLMTSLENSNTNFKWDWDEKKLTGLLFGGIFGEEEYERIDGSIGTSTKLKYIRTVQAIRDGKYKVPDIKKLPQKGEAFEEFLSNTNQDDDLPF